MDRILVLQHSAYEPLGLIIHTLKKMKLRVRYINFARNPQQRVDMNRYQGVVILGGPMHPNELSLYPHLQHEIDLIQIAIANKVPVLGICLGSQLLNIALGGSCYALAKPEFGWTQINKCGEHPLFKAFNASTQVFQWHQFASKPAAGVEVLLENKHCIQAFSYNSHCIGLQFHLEVDPNLLERWLQHPDYLEHLRRHLDRDEINAIYAQTKEQLPQSMAVARMFFADFCKLFKKQSYAITSRTAGRELF
ncbi:MAG: type 1 glutamine amidotransferase [Legionella sp.]